VAGSRVRRTPRGLWRHRETDAGLVAEAPTDFDRAASIASYLSQLELDETAENQLVSVASLGDFVFGHTPGTSMDFATAMTLMGRAAGLPTRLANGYLPGSYNPFSGANTVTQAEAHTWAEVAFQRAGWVPFDAAPRIGGTEAANSAGTGSNPLAKMLENRLGDRIAGEVGGGIGGGVSGLWKLLTNGFLGMAIMLIWFAIGVVGWYFWRRWKKTGSGISSYLRYSAIAGQHRASVLDSHRQAEALAARAGFRVRRRSEPYAEFARAAIAAGLPAATALTSPGVTRRKGCLQRGTATRGHIKYGERSPERDQVGVQKRQPGRGDPRGLNPGGTV